MGLRGIGKRRFCMVRIVFFVRVVKNKGSNSFALHVRDDILQGFSGGVELPPFAGRFMP